MREHRRILLADRVRRSITLLVSGSLLVATIGLCAATYIQAVDARREFADTMASLIGENLAAAIEFRDPQGVLDALKPLSDDDSIVAAEVRGPNQQLLGSLLDARRQRSLANAQADARHVSGRAAAAIASDVLSVRSQILRDGVVLGYVDLSVSMAPAYASMQRSSAFNAGILLLVFACTLPLSSRLGRKVVAPVQRLSATMTRVSEAHDYSLRASRTDDDEVGALVGRFNELLEQLQDRDAQLMSRQGELEALVAARTRELSDTNASLRLAITDSETARDAAQRANEAKSQFLANMSHELRTPLNGVIGMAELLRKTPLSERQTHFSATILASSRALLGVLDDVLDISKIEAGSMQLERTEFDLLDVIEESAQLFAESAARKGVELVCSTNIDRHMRVEGDLGRLRQVLINLLSNAIKFTEQGEVVLDVQDLADEGHPGVFSFAVRDTGIGMSAEVQARIFDAFVQADGSTSRRYGGTGLGLAISRSIVNLLGGELRVRSEPQRGAEFSFSLPFVLRQQPARVRAFDRRSGRILVIDDNETSARSVQRYLLNWGGVPVHATSITLARARCVEEAQRGGFGVILANHEHSGGLLIDAQDDGRRDPSSLVQVRQLAAEFDAACVVYASVDSLASIDESLGTGARLLAKPVRQSELFNALNGVLQHSMPTATDGVVAAPGALQDARILLVEDNLVNQQVALAHLQELGCTVTLANHGGEALALFKQRCFDAVLMDCQMPTMDGFETTRAIRVWEHDHPGAACGTRTPIIALTANALKGDRDRCLVAGMDDFLTKPFRFEALRTILEQWCVRSQEGRDGLANGLAEGLADATPATEPGRLTAAAQPPSTHFIDDGVWAGLQRMAERTPGFLARVLEAFAADAHSLGVLLADADTEPTQLAFAAHRSKSAASAVGALTLGNLLARLEQHARVMDHSRGAMQSLAGATIVAEVRAALQPTLAELRRRSGLALGHEDAADGACEHPTVAAQQAPAVDRAAAAKTASPSSLIESGCEDPPLAAVGKGVHVLVADDDVTSRAVVCGWLRADGYAVTEVGDGVQAQEAFAQTPFDIVLLDVLMPNCDGFACCMALRERPHGQHVPILLLTGLDDTESIHRGYGAGATDFMIKPIAEEILRNRLRYVLRTQVATARLRDSELRLRRTQNSARVSYWEWHPHTRNMRLGEGLLDMLGLDVSRPECSTDEFLAHVVEEDRGLLRTVDGGIEYLPASSEIRLIDRDGVERTIVQHLDELPAEPGGHGYWLATIQDITERRSAERNIYRISHFDATTGLPNQVLLRKSMQPLISQAERRGARMAYLVIDSGEQQVLASSLGNDHRASFLIELANRLRSHLRNSDFVAPVREPGVDAMVDDPRAALVHGDRFAAILNDVGDIDDVARLCERLVAVLSAQVDLGNEVLFPVVNVGIAVYPDDGDNYETLHQHALTALSSRSGELQSGWHWYQQERAVAMRERIALERDLRLAVDRRELQVHFQPRVIAGAQTPVGMEALVRWQRNGRFVSPMEFVPIAEQIGMISQLGEQVLEAALGMVSQWNRRGLPPLRVSVNVSAYQFRDASLPALCAAALDRFGVSADCLELELTESLLIEGNVGVLEQLKALKHLGVQLALDDFGTGFSSLAYLTRFPLDVLKIDRSFIDQLGASQSRVIVRSTLELAHDLGLRVVAEGVETAEQCEWLERHGCDELQGYYFSRPVPADDFEFWALQRLAAAQPPQAPHAHTRAT